MLKSYFLIALRNQIRHKLFSSITILGFAAAMTCVLLIGLYIWDELSYDRYHQHAGRIYRVVQEQTFTGSTQQLATTSGPVAAALKNDYPEIEAAVRILVRRNALLGYEDKQLYGENVAYTDPELFKVFSFSFLEGNVSQALKDPNTIVLTKKTAAKYFGEQTPLGKTIKLNNKPYTVTGIIKDVPSQSHFHFSCLASLSTLESSPWMQAWGITSLWTYVLVKPETNIAVLQKKLPPFIEKYHGEGYSKRIAYQLQPLTDIHLYSEMASEIEPNGSILFVQLFSVIAIFILVLACINYINLSTARASERMKEVGMRKIIGARRSQVAFQFFGA